MRRFSEVSTVAVAGPAQQRTSGRRRGHRLGALRLRSLRAHQEILRTHGRANCFPTCRARSFGPASCWETAAVAETTQFDMVRAFVFLAGLPVLPFRPDDRVDIVPVDYVADAIVSLHQKPHPETRDLSSFLGHATRRRFRQLTDSAGASARKHAAAVLARSGRAVPLESWSGWRGGAIIWATALRC